MSGVKRRFRSAAKYFVPINLSRTFVKFGCSLKPCPPIISPSILAQILTLSVQTMVSRLQRVPPISVGWSQEAGQTGAAQRMTHFIGMASYHVDFLSATSEDIPFFAAFDPQSKKALLREAVLEIILLRAASCHSNNSVRYEITKLHFGDSINDIQYNHFCGIL